MSIFQKTFSRVVVSIVAGCSALVFVDVVIFVYQVSQNPSVANWQAFFYPLILGIPLMGVPISLCSVLGYHYLTKKHIGLGIDRETRCRKCGYILKGITEPRCSECGEKI